VIRVLLFLPVPEAAPLLTLLRRIRRRLRWWMAVEGAVVGAAATAILVAGTVAIAHAAGHAVGAARPLALVLVGVALGALARGTRRVPLASCARFADAALDGQDRVLSAYCLRDDETPLARALVIDAAGRARTLTPGGAVAPRRPKGLPALAIGVAVLAAAPFVPVRSRAARAPVAPPAAPGVPVAANLLDVERDEARRAAADARVLHDERLAMLAEELHRTLQRLAAGHLSDGDALEKLSSLQRQTAEAAEQAARDAKALAAAQKALAAEAATRSASEALTAEDGDAGARARAALGDAAADNPKETARALAAAARGVGDALGAPEANDGSADGQRRLSREGDPSRDEAATTSEPARSNERRLERLQRNLDDTSKVCRAGDPSCRAQAEKRGEDLGQMARRGASAESLRRLERALRQMRDRVGRGELRGDQSAMRGFERAARGESGQPGQGQGQAGPGQGQQGDGVGTSPGQGKGQGQGDAVAEGKGGDGMGGEGKGQGKGDQAGKGSSEAGEGDGDGTGTGEAAALLERESRETSSNRMPGDGMGSGSGGPPLGRRGDMQARGRETEARVASGAGPNRAEVIGGAADRGFAERGYARVFGDYQAAVEDALAATAVPEGRRYVVRRYFDLIRPRSARAGKAQK
jgi:hypothetical protein